MSCVSGVASICSDLINKVQHKVYKLINHEENEDEREHKYQTTFHRFGSFAPVRHGAQVKFFVDGHDYCWAVSEAIENARHVVFIEDWWLTPELYLRRPPSKYPEFRIDKLLKRKAEQGVKIYIVVYKEVELAMTLDSKHTKDALQSLHENIIVQRHPDHAIGGTFFWSHHEKFVVVDNRIAFLGGIDLCFGRWDTHNHALADFQGPKPGDEVFPGQDYSDARVCDFKEVKNWSMHLVDKTVVPRMPWHDMSLCMLGGPVLDVARHFCERWNFIKHEKAMDKDNVPFLRPPLGGFAGHQRFQIPDENEHYHHHRYSHDTRGVKGNVRCQVLRSVGEWSLGTDTEHSIQNAYISTIHDAKYYVYIENQFFITATEEKDDNVLKNQIGQAIVKRIIRAHEEGEPFKVFVLMPLMPAFPADLSTKEAATARLVMHYQYISICRGSQSIIEKLKAAHIDPDRYIRFYSLRSYDRIHRRKLEEMLARAAGYSANVEPSVEEQVASTEIGERDDIPVSVKRSQEVFRAEECIAKDIISDNAMQGGDIKREAWLVDTPTSQPRDLDAEKIERDGYVSEECYIHAKLLIADDKVVIMGSANLNDRSQCGDRDSEIALYVEDQETIPSQMNGHYYEAAKFAATLRRQLWKEHLGLMPPQDLDTVNNAMLPLPVPQIDHTGTKEDRLVMDPLSQESLALWNNTARINTEAFRNVFHCVPDDSVTNWDEYHAFYPDPSKVDIGHVYDPEMPVDVIREELSKIRGHLVEFPLHFLENINLDGESIPFIGDTVQELYT